MPSTGQAGRPTFTAADIDVHTYSDNTSKTRADRMPEEEPPECDMADFSFKQLVKVQLDPISGTESNQRCHLLAVSNKYGLAFVGCANGFKVLRTGDLVVKGMERIGVGDTIVDFPEWAKVDTASPPCHLALSSDDLTLSVCVTRAAGVFALMFDIRAFATQSPYVAPFVEVRLSTTPEVRLTDLMWNPGDNFVSLFASCMSDGSVGLWQVMESVTVTAKLPTTVQATCLCWSPKGKQLVVGKTDGSLSQYDQQLKEKKRIPAPQTGATFSVVDVFWESTHVFVAAYALLTEPDMPILFTVQVPKGVSPIYRNYEDVCFGGGQDRKLKYYVDVIPHWNMILAASSNALETAILGRSQQDPNLWERWNLEDSSRSELPLTDSCDETYPMGVAIDFTSQTPIPFGENELYPAAPILLLLSTAGVLVAFHMINTRPGTPQLTQPHAALTSSGERKSNIPPPAVPAAPFQPPPPAAMSSHGDVADPKRSMHVIGQSQALSFGAGTVATSVAAPALGGGSKAPPPSFGVATSQSLFGFKPLGSSGVTLGSGITSQKGQLPQPLFGSNQSNNQPNASSVDLSSSQPSDTALSTLLGSATHSQGLQPQGTTSGITSAPSQDTLGFGSQLSAAGVQLAAVKSTDSSGAVAQLMLGRHTLAAVAKPVMTSVSAVLPRTDASSSDSVASTLMTHSDTHAYSGVQSDGDASLATTLRPNSNSAENLLQSSIKEEMQHFQTELSDLRSRAATVRVEIGSKEEVTQLKRSTHEMVTFCDEIRLTTQGISEEIDELRTRCLDSYATFEECRMRDIRNQSSDYKRLLHSRGLDPISDRHLKDIRMLDSTLKTKIRDVDANLDAEWEEYKRKKNVGRLLKTPATDNIYRTISNNQKVITSQRRTLTRLSGRAKDVYLSHGPQTPVAFVKPQLLNDPQDENIKTLTDKFMMTRLASISVVPAPVSPSKTSQLRQLLSSRSVTSVRTTTPRTLSMSQLVNSSALRDLQTCTQASQTMLVDNTMSQVSLTPAGSSSGGAGTTIDLPRTAARQNLLSQFGMANTLAIPSDQSASVVPDDAVKLPFPIQGRNGGLDLTKPGNYEPLAPKPSAAIKTLFGADASLPSVAPPSGFAATFGKSLNTDTLPPSLAIPSGFGATAGSSAPTETTQSSVAATAGLGTTFGTSQPTKAAQNDKDSLTSDPPQKPAAFNFASASRALTFGSVQEETTAESSKAPFTFSSDATDPKPFKFGTPGTSFFGGGLATSSTGDTPTPSFFGSNLAGSSTSGAPSSFGAGLAAGSSAGDTPSLFGGISASAISAIAQQKDESSAGAAKEKKLSATDETDPETGNYEKTEEDDNREELPRKSGTVKKSLLSEMLVAGKESSTVADTPSGDSLAKPPPIVTSFPAAAPTLTSLLESSIPATSEAVTTTGDSQASVAPASTSFFGGATFSFGAESKADQPLFGASTTTTAKPIFGSTPLRKVDGSSESKADQSFGATTAKPIFGSTPEADTSSTPSGTTDVAPSTLFAPSKPSGDSTATLSALLGGPSTATTAPLFGAPATTATLLFGGANVATTMPLFGNAPTSTVTTTAPSFGSTVTPTTATASPVSPVITTTTPTALFGNTVTTTKPATSLFGGITTTTTTPLFGGAMTTTTTTPAAPIFGGVTTTTTAPLYGGAVTTTTTTPAAPIFGGITAVAAPIFGGVTTTTAAPLFGNSSTTGSVFGGGSVATSSPAFGSVTTTTTPSVFGGNTTTTSSAYGGSSTGQTSGSIFGRQPSSTAGTSLFGQPQQGAVFGQPNSVFGGQPAATTAPLFGGQQTAPAFGGTATFGQTPTSSVFGQPAAGGVFGQPSAPSSGGGFAGGGGGGGMFSGLGGKPSAENANKNVFGASQAFGGNQQTSSLFGGQAADKFNTVKTTAGFGSSFGGSGGPTGSVMSSGFGFQSQPTATASPGGTGQAVFGGGGVFGGSPNFGAPSGFGSASFASPFGGGIAPGSSPAPGGMFGATPGNAQPTGGFAGFATNSQSPTFGSLAGNTTQQQQPTFGGSGFGDAGAGASAFGGGSSFGGFNSPSSAAPSFTAYRN